MPMILPACLFYIMGALVYIMDALALPLPPRQWLLTALRSLADAADAADAAGELAEQRWSPGWGTSLVTGPSDTTERGARP